MHPLTHHHTILNGLRFHVSEQGEGPLVLLLHGFPEFWYSWHFQLPALAAAGFRAVAPDLRGYNLSEKPPGVASYHIDHLVADVAAMLREWGDEAGGYLVGHDWGGVIAWSVAARHPELVKKLVILNAPLPARYLEVLRETPVQVAKSYYAFLFQLPWLPERLLTLGTPATVRRFFLSTGLNPAHMTEEDARAYYDALTQPGAATAMLNYYRSNVRQIVSEGGAPSEPPISAPTLLLWGRRDVALDARNAERDKLLRWVSPLRVEPLEASHWPHLDIPEQVNRHLLDFLGAAGEG